MIDVALHLICHLVQLVGQQTRQSRHRELAVVLVVLELSGAHIANGRNLWNFLRIGFFNDVLHCF